MAVSFAPRRTKRRIYPTLKRQIETNSSLIDQKVGRKIFRVLGHVIYFPSLNLNRNIDFPS